MTGIANIAIANIIIANIIIDSIVGVFLCLIIGGFIVGWRVGRDFRQRLDRQQDAIEGMSGMPARRTDLPPEIITLAQRLGGCGETGRVVDHCTFEVATGTGTRHSRVRLILDDDGDIAEMTAPDRPFIAGRMVSNRPWFGRCSDYRMIGGRRIACRAEVGWYLDETPFIYWRGRIDSWALIV